MEQHSLAPIHKDDEGNMYFNKELVSSIMDNSISEQVITIMKDANILNVLDSSGNTLLHIAAQYRNDVITKHVIHSGINIDIQNSLRKTPLIVSIESDCQNSTRILLEANANTLIFDNAGKSALHYFLNNEWFRDLYVVWKFLRNVESQCLENSEVIATKLMDAGWPLASVTLLENTEVIEVMLKRGCQVNARDPGVYRTALHQAVLSTDLDLVNLLLDYGADPNALDKFSRTPLNYVYDVEPKHIDERPEIVKLLIAKGALTFTPAREFHNGNQVDSALRLGNGEVIQVLLGANLDLTRRHDFGDTPVHILTTNKKADAFAALNNYNFEVDSRNDYLETPLWYAAAHGNVCAVTMLLEKGADVNAANCDSYLPIHKCVAPCARDDENRYKECAQLLLEYGADVQGEFSIYGESTTIFDIVRRGQTYYVGELLIAHLILQEARGTPIDEMIYYKIQSHSTFRNYYDFCKKKGAVKLFKSVTLLDLLSASDVKFQSYVRDQQCASSIEKVKNKWHSKLYYYNTILQKRYSEAVHRLKLRNEAAIHICKIMKTDYFRFPLIADQIANYFDEIDLQSLLQVSL